MKTISIVVAFSIVLFFMQISCISATYQSKQNNISNQPIPLNMTSFVLDSTIADSVCNSIECRDGFEFDLIIGGNKGIKGSITEKIPYVFKNSVYLFPGETMFVEAEESNNQLVNLRKVDFISDSSKTLVLSFSQSKPKVDMWFNLQHRFSKPIKYHMAIAGDLSKEYYQTTSCPVYPKVSGSEHWPFPIANVILYDFRLVDGNASRNCSF